MTAVVASLDALREELVDAGPDSLLSNTRLGLQLSDDEAAELVAKVWVLIDEYAHRKPTSGGKRIGLLFTLHRLDPPETPLGDGGVSERSGTFDPVHP